jgi:hypothetical protein
MSSFSFKPSIWGLANHLASGADGDPGILHITFAIRHGELEPYCATRFQRDDVL